MKLLITSALLLLAFVAKSQTVTNIDVRATATVIVTGTSTNAANTTFTMLASTAKDKVRIDGLSYAYFLARANGFTNTFDNWIAKTWAKDAADVTARAKLQADAVTTIAKLADLLQNNYDLLSAGDISNLNTIAAKSPITP